MACSCCGPPQSSSEDAHKQLQDQMKAASVGDASVKSESVVDNCNPPLEKGCIGDECCDDVSGASSGATCEKKCCGVGDDDGQKPGTNARGEDDKTNEDCCVGEEVKKTVQQGQIPLNLNTCVDECCNIDRKACGGKAEDERASLAQSCGDGCCDEAPAAAKRTEVCDVGCCADVSEQKEIGSCQDSCCDEAPLTAKPSETCEDKCCDDTTGKDEADTCKDACCGGAPLTAKPTKSCEDKCCDDASGNDEAGSCKDACCGEIPPISQPVEACNDGCCSDSAEKQGTKIIQQGDVPDCCRGKTSPCCDESCLDRLALRECDDGSSISCENSAAKGCCSTSAPVGESSTKHTPCSRHRRSIRQKYAAQLEALGCICRALLALGQESCCPPRPSSSLSKKKRCSRKSSQKSLSREPTESCCSGPKTTCKKPVVSVVETVDSCCGGGNSCSQIANDKKPAETASFHLDKSDQDIEKQALSSNRVALSISGMTCTGCETKLNRTLASVAGMKNLKTSLVLSRVEFDMEPGVCTVDDVVKHIERTTEFKCEVITKIGSTIDVLVDGNASRFIDASWPDGVIDMSAVKSNTVRVVFEPEVVGARDLIERHWPELKLAPVCAEPALAASGKHVRHVGYTTILSAILTIPVLVMAWAPIPKREVAYGSASLALASLVQIFIAGPFYPKAIKALVFSQVIEMDLLIVLSTSAAYIFSVVSFGYLIAGKPLSTGQFFESSTLLVTLIMVGRYVAAFARQRAVESISIRSLQASTALLVEHEGATTREIDTRLLQYGDFFKILPDTKIPTDGTVVSGTSEVDESMLTGESLPVDKAPKSRVIAGTINGSGAMVIRLTRLPGDNTINTIASMVDEAKLSKPKIQDLADKVASYFVPVVVALTIITFVIWVGVGIKVQGKTGSDAVVQSITYAITVLIVSCPCAIGLAVPMVVVIASGIAAERGVIFKSADAIEQAYRTTHVVFDKTGTLTKGKLSVVSEHWLNQEKLLPSLLAGLVQGSKHPVSVAVAAHLHSTGTAAASVTGVKSITGKGVSARAGNRTLQAGNSQWLNVSSNVAVASVLHSGHTTFCFVVNGVLAAVFALEDSIREDAGSVVSELQNRGVSVHMVSGDDEGAVTRAAQALNIPPGNVLARSSPADKRAYIKTLFGDLPDSEKPVVIFCGDGTNDAAALAQASVGVHMNQNSDVAQSAADVVLVRPVLSGILTVMNASRVSVRRIVFNFTWSAVYNTFAVLLAAGAFEAASARIPPEFAGLGELVSVLPVVAAAVMLRWSTI